MNKIMIWNNEIDKTKLENQFNMSGPRQFVNDDRSRNSCINHGMKLAQRRILNENLLILVEYGELIIMKG